MIILDELNKKETNGPRIQATFMGSRQINFSLFVTCQDYNELPKKKIRANGNIFYIFKPSNYRDIQNLYKDKPSLDITLNKLKYPTSTCWNEKHQPVTIDMTKDNHTGRYRLGLNSLLIPDSYPF